MALLDEHAGVMNGFGETELVDTGLQAALKEVFDAQGEYIIELHAGLVEHTGADETAN